MQRVFRSAPFLGAVSIATRPGAPGGCFDCNVNRVKPASRLAKGSALFWGRFRLQRSPLTAVPHDSAGSASVERRFRLQRARCRRDEGAVSIATPWETASVSRVFRSFSGAVAIAIPPCPQRADVPLLERFRLQEHGVDFVGFDCNVDGVAQLGKRWGGFDCNRSTRCASPRFFRL